MKYTAYAVIAVAALALGFVLGGLQHGSNNQDGLPQQPPDFTLTDINGQSHSLADYQDKVLLLNFWATWCTPCLKEIPRLQAAHEQYASQGLAIVGPALDDSAAVNSFVAAHTMEYPVIVGDQNLFDLMDALGDELGALPFTVVINRAGDIVERHSGELSQKQLDRYLADYL